MLYSDNLYLKHYIDKSKEKMENTQSNNDNLIKVSASSNARSTASHISHRITEHNRTVEIRAIGAAAVNQAVKAIAIARGFVAPRGYNLTCVPSFATVDIGGSEKSATLFIVHATS